MATGAGRDLGVISVRDIVHHGLPAGTTIVAGATGNGREVTWATRLRPAPPAFGHISGGEIVFLPPGVLDLIDDRLNLADAIRQLATFGVAAVAITGEADSAACAAADAASVPLLVLPPTVDFGHLERETARAIAERRRVLQQHGQETGRKLMELAIAGESLTDLTTEFSRLGQRAVALEGRDGGLLSFQSEPENLVTEETAQRILQQTNTYAQAWLRSVGSSSAAEPPVHAWTTDGGWTRIVAPVTGRTGLLGNVSILVPAGQEGPEDSVLASRAAAASAVALAREQAAASVRREVELNVLDEMLDGALRSEISLSQQAQRLGHDLNQEFCTLNARVDPAQAGPARSREGRWAVLEDGLRRAQRNAGLNMLWRVRNTSAEVVWPVTNAGSPAEISGIVQEELTDALQSHGFTEVVSIGIGRPGHGIQGIRRSHQEARQALTLGRRLHGTGHITDFDALGIYRLILAAEQLPELRAFQDEALGSLVSYDRVHRSNLTQTLEAFFAANCSPKEAASILDVHRNTVLYRLDRISEITGLQLDDPDTRLRLHLALHIRLALDA
ncbi:MAG TPA: helix-turn-helix domain-containing protein [Thermomicrobiales bacterium]|nr:helix-turn-helix domain-containing protein [Thermomicrobiales bacterium]